MLPDGEHFLRQVDKGLARPKRLTAVRGANDGDQGSIADRERPDSMGHHEAYEIESANDGLGHVVKHRSGSGVAFVRERTDDPAVVMVAHSPTEYRDGTCLIIGSQPLQSGEIEGMVGHVNPSDDWHCTIIDRGVRSSGTWVEATRNEGRCNAQCPQAAGERVL